MNFTIPDKTTEERVRPPSTTNYSFPITCVGKTLGIVEVVTLTLKRPLLQYNFNVMPNEFRKNSGTPLQNLGMVLRNASKT